MTFADRISFYKAVKVRIPEISTTLLAYCLFRDIFLQYVTFPAKRFLCNHNIHFHTKPTHSNEYLKLSVIGAMQATNYPFSADYCGYCCKLLKAENPATFLKSLDLELKIRRAV